MRNKHSKVTDPRKFVTSSGEKFHVLFQPIVKDDGTIDLVESDKFDIQARINSYRDQTDLAFILSRLQVGDTSVLNNSAALYGDFTSVPTSMAQVLQSVIDGRRYFDSLDISVRQQFGNDFNRWLASAGSSEWLAKMNLAPVSVVSSDPVQDVKEVEVSDAKE